MIMLALGWTNTLNVDMWNVANKILQLSCSLCNRKRCHRLCGSCIQIIGELKNADATKPTKEAHRCSRYQYAAPHVPI